MILKYYNTWASLAARTIKNLPATQDPGSIPGSGRSPGEVHGNPLQYSCLENPTHRGAGGLWPMGSQESDTTEQLALSLSQHTIS